MTDDDIITAFMDAHPFPAAAFIDADTPRLWYEHLEGGELVFQLAPGEADDDLELTTIAAALLRALVSVHPRYAYCTFRLDES